MIIRARAPLRVGLAGGGTDVSPFCDEFGGLVLNATIARYAYATISHRKDNLLVLNVTDKNFREALQLENEIALSGVAILLRATYLHMMNNFNNGNLIPLEVSTFCDSPPGSGLGTSSTLVVAMVKGFSGFLSLSLDEHRIAQIAYIIERVECNFAGGRQDQYSAAFGGFNFIEFKRSGLVVVNPIDVKPETVQELEASLLLFFTGVSRDSDKIINDQSRRMRDKNKIALEALENLKIEAKSMKDNISTGNFLGFTKAMDNSWNNKKKSSDVISNPLIEKIFNSAIESGAVTGKVSGAGGGGFMIFFVPLEKRKDVIESLNNYNGEISNIHFTDKGAQFWKIN